MGNEMQINLGIFMILLPSCCGIIFAIPSVLRIHFQHWISVFHKNL
jgi:hypothetical protein